jgi:translation elongation factor EF-1alpha
MEQEVGRITHYFSKINVGVLELSKGVLHVGDTIHIKGHTSDFYQKMESMQVDNNPVDSAKPGEPVGIKVESPVRENDIIFKVTED